MNFFELVIIYSGSIIIVGTCSFLLLQFIGRINVAHSTNVQQQWLSEHREAIDLFFDTGHIVPTLIPIKYIDYYMLEQLFVERVVQRPSTVPLVKSFIEQYLWIYYKKCLKSTDEFVRLRTIIYLRQFNVVSFRLELFSLLFSKRISIDERAHIFMALASFKEIDILEKYELVQDLLSATTIRTALSLLVDADTLPKILTQFNRYPRKLQQNLLIVFQQEADDTASYRQFLREKFHDDLLRVTVMECMLALNNHHFDDLLTDYLQKPYDEIVVEARMVSAKLLGQLTLDSLIPYLLQLLTDKRYDVRQQAALSLTRYPQGRQLLTDVSLHHDDRFARDVASEWLERSLYER